MAVLMFGGRLCHTRTGRARRFMKGGQPDLPLWIPIFGHNLRGPKGDNAPPESIIVAHNDDRPSRWKTCLEG